MIYTSYYGKLKDLPKDVVPISISLKVPDGVHICSFTDLVPTPEMLSLAKSGRYVEYEERYNSEILDELDIDQLVEDIFDIVDGEDGEHAALICFEKCGFCHRHLVSKRLREAGYMCKEFGEE